MFTSGKIPKKLQVTLCQLSVGSEVTANLAKAESFISEAAKRGSRLVVLPECFTCPYGIKYFSKYAESIEPGNPTYDLISSLARKFCLWITAGSIPEKKGQQFFNTSMTFGPDGLLKHVHRKVHLFRIFTEDVKMDEGEILSPGCAAEVVEMEKNLKFGVGICFDIRYPQLSWRYSSQGSSFLIYPGAFNKVSGPLHWELLGRARAVDTQQYVLLCSSASDTNAEYVAWGHSMVIDPEGKVVKQLDEDEGFIDCELDFEFLEETRKRFPTISGERKDLYCLDWISSSSKP